MSLEDRKRKARQFIEGIARGGFPDGLMADEFFAWSGISHKVERDEYLRRVSVIGQVFTDGGLRFIFDRITAEGHTVALQARGEGTLFTGEHYTQSYLFIVEFNDCDEVRHVREYIDTHIVHTMLRPAMVKWAERQAA